MKNSVKAPETFPPVQGGEEIVYATTDEEQKAKPVGVKVRIAGLDMARGLSMLIVVLVHGVGLLVMGATLYDQRVGNLLSLLANFSVELFFAISGFLIGGILLRDVVPDPTPKAMGGYLAKRWLRTVPVYFVVLGAEMLLIGWYYGSTPSPWKYVFFVQNFSYGTEYFFPVSWSLTIEQWSYLVLPLVMVPLTFFVARRWRLSYEWALLWTVLALIALFTLLRTGTAWLLYTPDQLDVGIRKQIPLRLDVLFYGVLIVHCKFAWPGVYRRLASLPFFLCVLLLSVLYVVFQYNDNFLVRLPDVTSYSLFHSGIGFTITDILTALLLPFLDINPRSRGLARLPRIQSMLLFAAKYSYAVYLVHILVIRVFSWFVPLHLPAFPVLELIWRLALMCVAVLCSFALAWVLYYTVEKPGMSLRRFIPK